MEYSELIKRSGIGLTGGIATGKSTVAKILRDLDYKVFDADTLSREVVMPGTAGLAQIVSAFGAAVLTESGELDRQQIANRVFNDQAQRKTLEAIIHPLIHERLTTRLKQEKLIDGQRFWFYEAALLFETGAYKKFRATWVTFCPEKEQLRRVGERDNHTTDFARKIIATQMSAKEKAERSDYLINTDAPLVELKPKVLNALEQMQKNLPVIG